jgi:hypothetical protein
MIGRNIIIAGVPRSGTTMTCFLLNKLDNTVALDEPFGRELVEHREADAFCQEIVRFYERSRESLLRNRTGLSRQADGRIPDNIIGDEFEQVGEARLRQGFTKTGVVSFDKSLTEDFPLLVKQVAVFAPILGSLVGYFPCFAVMRNPLSVLGSWNSVQLPYYRGRVPPAEQMDRSLKRALKAIDDRLERQLYLLSWFYEQIHRHLPREAVVFYEDVIESRGKALRTILPEASSLDEPLESRNRSRFYDAGLRQVLAQRLLDSDGAYWQFYSKESVQALATAGDNGGEDRTA